MPKWCYNYDSGEYEYIERDGYSIDRGEYVYNWDDSEYRREEEEEERRLWDDEEDWQCLKSCIHKKVAFGCNFATQCNPYQKLRYNSNKKQEAFASCFLFL